MNTKVILKQYITDEILDKQNVDLQDEDQLVGGGFISSLGVVQLVSFIEEKFGVTVPYEDVTVENFRNLKTLSEFVNSLEN